MPVEDSAMTSPRPQQLDYLPSQHAAPYRWPVFRAIGWIASIAAILLAVDKLTCTELEIRVDPITGSTSRRTIGVFGIMLWTNNEISSIDARLEKMGRPHTPTWQFVCSNGRDMLFGRWCGCGFLPEIGQMRSMLDQYAASATDAELLEFVNVMQSGTSAQKQAAVDAACEKRLQALR